MHYLPLLSAIVSLLLITFAMLWWRTKTNKTSKTEINKTKLDKHQFFSHPRDKAISFDARTHTYTVNGEKMQTSVTGLIDEYFYGFPANSIVKKMLESKDFPHKPIHQKYHIMPIWAEVIDDAKMPIDAWKPGAVLRDQAEAESVIKKSWSAPGLKAAKEGTKLHKQIEDYIKYDKMPEMTKEFEMFLTYHNNMLSKGYIPYSSEQKVYDVDLQLAGCVDMLYVKDNEIYLVDWKRSKQVLFKHPDDTKRKKKGKNLLKTYDDCNGVHFTFQLNIYKELLEMHYGSKVVTMEVVVFHPDNDSYLSYNIENKKEVVQTMFEERRAKARGSERSEERRAKLDS